jgi:hypothetical protein
VKESINAGVVGSASIAPAVAGSNNGSMVSDWWWEVFGVKMGFLNQ